ncbi:hypothetical protein niasHT_017665 [Heterodera trifolii]|uniref:Uncharacterized protein n=1 Tax=Heterodera trifolii TaxID=157864 RepID=A0ABD2L8F9_9BILA
MMQMIIFLSTICCFLFLANHLQRVAAEYVPATVFFPGTEKLKIEIRRERDESFLILETTKANEKQYLELHKSRWNKYDGSATIYFTDVSDVNNKKELGSATVKHLRKSNVVLDFSAGTLHYYPDGSNL